LAKVEILRMRHMFTVSNKETLVSNLCEVAYALLEDYMLDTKKQHFSIDAVKLSMYKI
jgi:hypothetical protein